MLPANKSMLWAGVPKRRWAARSELLTGALVALELGYLMFFPVRPIILRRFEQFLKLQSIFAGTKAGWPGLHPV